MKLCAIPVANALQQQPGDMLVFLTGREEIDRCMEELSELLPSCVD